ncbi:Mitochondrial inner membrane protease Atp23 [Malassezia pachydermatis]|uniref:Mitochondrial inner membrane protease ATP23 n=1 Tax=Malassezia pachydermatis TaxID=77020 RepID=A0A0M9VNL6_9BASI|nr:mitochondrial inner membrane protease [Malassezia pachydermatis]KOS13483.1 mitochondrial inner membrane protease [Malassezia pachydermatis]
MDHAPFARWLTWCQDAYRSCAYPVHVPAEQPLLGEETKEDMIARQRVEQWKEDLLRTSPMVRFMVKQLTMLRCDPVSPRENEGKLGKDTLPPKLLIASCPPDIAGGFSPSAPGRPPSEAGVLLCANRIYSKSHLEDTLAHEMIHWWDHCRFQVDWNNLRHHACSEIRAASLSGDCRWMREVNRRHFAFSKQHQECAKRRAILSVRANPACKDDETATRVVEEVWESCFYDTRPFDEIY